MKTIQIFSILFLFFFNLTTYAQTTGCNCILQFDQNKDVPTDETIETLNFDYWVTMDPASEQNKRSECGNRCILPSGTKVVRANGVIARIWACNNKPLTWEKVNGNQPNTNPNVNNGNQNNGNGNPQVIVIPVPQSADSEKNCCGLEDYKSGLQDGKQLYSDGVDKGLQAAIVGNSIGNNGNGGNGGTVVVQQQRNNAWGYIASAVVGGVVGYYLNGVFRPCNRNGFNTCTTGNGNGWNDFGNGSGNGNGGWGDFGN